MSLKPLVSIIGTTGVGKSRLAIEIALALSARSSKHESHGAKVINADSMQVYAGADVITNKVPESQQKGIEHLLMGFKEPGEQYVVGQWVTDAVQEIDKLHRHNSVPIVVGGTSYWMQHLLFPNRLTSFEDPQSPKSSKKSTPPSLSPALQRSISSLPGPLLELFTNLPEKPHPQQAYSLYELLTRLDPRMAARWHWNDTRKVLRNLEIIKEKGIPASEVMDQQSQYLEEPRYRTLIFWLFSYPELLHPRLDARVDHMIQQGLVDDVRMLRRIASGYTSFHQQHSSGVDTTCGIFQSIGFKEFDSYLSTEAPSQALYESCIDRTRLSTRHYAKRQLQWIQNKLLPAINISNKDELKTAVYLLNVTDPQRWHLEVQETALNLVHDFLAKKELPDPRTLSETAKSMLDMQKDLQSPTTVLSARRKVVCKLCTADSERPFMVEDGPEWRSHLRSRKHRRREREQVCKGGPEKRAQDQNTNSDDIIQSLASVEDWDLDFAMGIPEM